MPCRVSACQRDDASVYRWAKTLAAAGRNKYEMGVPTSVLKVAGPASHIRATVECKAVSGAPQYLGSCQQGLWLLRLP